VLSQTTSREAAVDNTHTNLAIRSSLALALALAIWSPAHGQSP
jgi:hypothetical protein